MLQARRVRSRQRCLPVVVLGRLLLLVPAFLPAPTRAAAAAAPAVRIFEAPPACCFGVPAGLVRGVATGVDPDSAVVALYAATDLQYVQPIEGSRLGLDAAGRFESLTHGGSDYAALLVRPDFVPPPTLVALPEVGGPVLAVTRASTDIRHIQFAGCNWGVKAAPVPLGPGGNSWSDSPANVWVDPAGALHLRVARRDSIWECAEVWTDERIDFGRCRFRVASSLGSLDINVVFAGFLFADTGAEADIEWGRFGVAAAENLHFAVQPDRSMSAPAAVDAPTVQDLTWWPDTMDFAVRDAANVPVAAWRAPGPAPAAPWMRLRFNLWLAGGVPPADGAAVEVVVSGVEFATPAASAESAPPQLSLVVANPALQGRLVIRTAASDRAQGTIDVFDVRGRRVGRAWNGPVDRASITWPPRTMSQLAAGVYLVRLNARTETIARKVVVSPLAR